jgi:hypothetical protein
VALRLAIGYSPVLLTVNLKVLVNVSPFCLELTATKSEMDRFGEPYFWVISADERPNREKQNTGIVIKIRINLLFIFIVSFVIFAIELLSNFRRLQSTVKSSYLFVLPGAEHNG